MPRRFKPRASLLASTSYFLKSECVSKYLFSMVVASDDAVVHIPVRTFGRLGRLGTKIVFFRHTLPGPSISISSFGAHCITISMGLKVYKLCPYVEFKCSIIL